MREKTFQTQDECSVSSVPLSHDLYKENGSTLSTGVDSPAEGFRARSDDLWTFLSLIRLYKVALISHHLEHDIPKKQKKR